jgi:hypothetical protein
MYTAWKKEFYCGIIINIEERSAIILHIGTSGRLELNENNVSNKKGNRNLNF